MSILSKIFSFIKGLFTRPGLDRFLDEYIDIAREAIEELALVRSGESFHEWKREVFLRLRDETKQMRDNWVEILVSLAYEEWKARRL